MKKKNKFKVGDKIIELGEVFRIFKIEERKDNNGKPVRVIFYNPYYQTEKTQSVICSIPVKSISQTQIRRPIKRKEFMALVEKLSKRKHIDSFCDLNIAKTLLKSNNPSDTIDVLRSLLEEKKEAKENFSKSKKDILNETINILIQEFALVSGLSLEKAREKIDLALQ